MSRTGFRSLDRAPDADDRTRRNWDRLRDLVITPYRSVTAETTLSIDDWNGTLHCLSGTFTVHLPPAKGIAGVIFTVKNSGSGVISVDGDGSELIDGSAIKTVLGTEWFRFQSTGTGWILV